MKPIKDLVIVRKDNKREESTGISFSAPEKDLLSMMFQPGIVHSVGEEVYQIKTGDRVLYNQHSTWPQRINGETLLVMSITSVGVILEEGDKIY